MIGRFGHWSCDPDMMAYMSNYIVQCQILEHEDHGMMAQLKVMS